MDEVELAASAQWLQCKELQEQIQLFWSGMQKQRLGFFGAASARSLWQFLLRSAVERLRGRSYCQAILANRVPSRDALGSVVILKLENP